jgi:hypothetical protein
LEAPSEATPGVASSMKSLRNMRRCVSLPPCRVVRSAEEKSAFLTWPGRGVRVRVRSAEEKSPFLTWAVCGVRVRVRTRPWWISGAGSILAPCYQALDDVVRAHVRREHAARLLELVDDQVGRHEDLVRGRMRVRVSMRVRVRVRVRVSVRVSVCVSVSVRARARCGRGRITAP